MRTIPGANLRRSFGALYHLRRRFSTELAALLERLTDGWVIDALRAAAAKEQGTVASTALGALVEALSVK